MISFLKRFNWIQFVAMVALIVLGTMTIYSAGHARSQVAFHAMWQSNLLTAAVGFVLYFMLAAADYRKVLGLLAWPGYVTAIVLLIAVLVFGSTVYGGKRWLWFFQPSELSKLCVIVLLASFLGREEAARWRGFFGFLLSGLLIGVPCLLILAEPDLGTTLTLVPAAFVILLVARVWRRGLVILLATLAVAALSVLGAVYEAERPGVSAERRERILKWVPLHEHQIRRVKTFLFPEADALGSGYNLRQAKISVGSGGFTGKGWCKGESNHLKYLPPAISMNDFIFCVYAEERGFVGSLVLLALFAMLVLSGCWIAFVSGNDSGRLLALGVSTLLFAHVYINIAMSIGLVPITGLPLPFISSGRTFLLTVMCGLGFVQSISIHREEKSLK